MKQFLFYFLIINGLALLAMAQFPPRPQPIPGALPAPLGPRQQFRTEKLVRGRRPVALRSQSVAPALPQRLHEETKPVTEAPEDEDSLPDVFLPTLLREQQLAQAQQAQFHQQAQAFLNNVPNDVVDTPTPVQQLLQHEETVLLQRPSFNDYGIGSGVSASRFERPQQNSAPVSLPPPQPQPAPQRVNVIRQRPARPQYEAQVNHLPPPPPPAPTRPRPKPVQQRPIEQNQLQHEERRQRPVAQTIRKWREENEDGSITWGYENDDGSFKEEIIGTDCVTKGTYGYVDPDGNKREYNYETGIKCDPNTRETEEETQENGFINYEENKAILPNGIEIDMTQLGKKKSKRPGAQLRNY